MNRYALLNIADRNIILMEKGLTQDEWNLLATFRSRVQAQKVCAKLNAAETPNNGCRRS